METPNYTIINALAKGDDEVKKMILEVLIEEFPLEKESYFNYFNLKDFKKTQEIVHKIKHKISVLGLDKSYELANIYENNLLNSSIENHKDFEKTLEVISSFIKSIS
jgi:hypothetical protein